MPPGAAPAVRVFIDYLADHFIRDRDQTAVQLPAQSGSVDGAAGYQRYRRRRAHAGETREEKRCDPKDRTKQARPPWRVPRDQDE
jgi:hypothetical protein